MSNEVVRALTVKEFAQRYNRAKYGPKADGTYTMKSYAMRGNRVVPGTTVFDMKPVIANDDMRREVVITRNGERLSLSEVLVYAADNPRFFGWIFVREREFLHHTEGRESER
jgi:hypothetical protein